MFIELDSVSSNLKACVNYRSIKYIYVKIKKKKNIDENNLF